MESYKSLGYKDFWTRLVVLFNGVVLMALLIYIPYLYFSTGDISVWYIVALLIFGLSFYMIVRLLNNLMYEFTKEGIKLYLPSGKTYFLEKENIKNIEKLGKLRFYYGIGIRVSPITGDILFTTSLKNAYKISMEDGRSIIITPRKISQDVIKYYIR